VFDLIRGHATNAGAVLCAFDLLEVNGEDIRGEPIEDRKRRLAGLLRLPHDGIAINEHFGGTSGCSRWRGLSSVWRRKPLGAIARKAIDRKTGARGLRSIMEAILLDSMFDLPSLEGVKEIVISQQVVEGTAGPLYMYGGGMRAS
jgi:hypothetical protein